MAKQVGKEHKYLYANNVNMAQDAFGGYEEENVERMRDVSRKYDPEGVFQKLRNGGPKLF